MGAEGTVFASCRKQLSNRMRQMLHRNYHVSIVVHINAAEVFAGPVNQFMVRLNVPIYLVTNGGAFLILLTIETW